MAAISSVHQGTPLNLVDSRKNYETLRNIAEIVKIAGLVLLIGAPVGAALFFGAPVTVPLLVAILIGCIPLTFSLAGDTRGFLKLFSFAPSTAIGIVTGVFVGKRTWTVLENFVYVPQVAAIAGIAVGCIGALGLVLYAAGYFAEKELSRKISLIKR